LSYDHNKPGQASLKFETGVVLNSVGMIPEDNNLASLLRGDTASIIAVYGKPVPGVKETPTLSMHSFVDEWQATGREGRGNDGVHEQALPDDGKGPTGTESCEMQSTLDTDEDKEQVQPDTTHTLGGIGAGGLIVSPSPPEQVASIDNSHQLTPAEDSQRVFTVTSSDLGGEQTSASLIETSGAGGVPQNCVSPRGSSIPGSLSPLVCQPSPLTRQLSPLVSRHLSLEGNPVISLASSDLGSQQKSLTIGSGETSPASTLSARGSHTPSEERAIIIEREPETLAGMARQQVQQQPETLAGMARQQVQQQPTAADVLLRRNVQHRVLDWGSQQGGVVHSEWLMRNTSGQIGSNVAVVQHQVPVWGWNPGRAASVSTRSVQSIAEAALADHYTSYGSLPWGQYPGGC
jgi:hypothetical protein